MFTVHVIVIVSGLPELFNNLQDKQALFMCVCVRVHVCNLCKPEEAAADDLY